MMRVVEVANDVVGIFHDLSVEYAVMGGLAVRLHGLPRPTFDIDFTAAIHESKLPDIYGRVERLGYSVPEPQKRGWVDTVSGFPVVKFQTFQGECVIDVDVFLAGNEFLKQILRRRQRHRTDELEADFVTAEDLILLKLLAGRRKDLVDIQDILLVQGKLDDDYLNEWAPRLNVAEALAEAYREAGR
jgi:hypothetical protein